PGSSGSVARTLSESVLRHQRHQVAGARGVGPSWADSGFDLPASDAVSVRLRSGHAASFAARALCQPLLGTAGALGERLGRPESDCGSGLQGWPGRAAVATAAGRKLAGKCVGESVSGECLEHTVVSAVLAE